jgi:hypothetical protein
LVGKHRTIGGDNTFACGHIGEEGVVTFGDELYAIYSEVAGTKAEVLKQTWSAPPGELHY